MDAYDFVKGSWDAVKSFTLYNVYGIGYRWSFPSDMINKEPDSFVGKLSKMAMDELSRLDGTPEKEIGYWLSGCGIPASIVGEGLYYIMNNKNGKQ